VNRIYNSFKKVVNEIYQVFDGIEKKAADVQDLTKLFEKSNCRKMAETILSVKASKLLDKIKKQAKKTFKFLFNSHKGFMCSICDAKTFDYYNYFTNEITVSKGFCKAMVEKTLSYYINRYVHLPQVTRLYGQFMVNCNADGYYNPFKYLRKQEKLYKRARFVSQLISCRKNLKEDMSVDYCTDFCENFHPNRLDKYLEGELERLSAFLNSMKRKVTLYTKVEKADMEIHKDPEYKETLDKAKVDVFSSAKRKRVLGEVLKRSPYKKLKEDISELNRFNKTFRTSLLKPISYRFKEDLSIKVKVNYDEPIVPNGVEAIYDVNDFISVFNKNGVHFYRYGESASFDRETASEVFENITEPEEEFKKIMKLK